MEVKNEHLLRQADLIPDTKLNIPIHIIGCGAIGSFLGLSLAKMGASNLSFYDFDTVSIENMSNQFFPASAIGVNKAEALSNMIKAFTVGIDYNYKLNYFPTKVTPEDVKSMRGIVVLAVDSMEVRKDLFLAMDGVKDIRYIIDPRMSAEHYMQITTNNNVQESRTRHGKFMYTDGEAVAERCTAKSTVYTATLAAGMITKTIKDILLNAPVPHYVTWSIANHQQLVKLNEDFYDKRT